MRLHQRWILACALAETLGVGTIGLVALGLSTTVGEPATLAGRLLLLAGFGAAGALEGLALGALQWRVLRDVLPRLAARAWIGVTVAIAMLGWLVGMAAPILAGPGDAEAAGPPLAAVLAMALVLGAGAGALFGAAQWLVLRHHARHAGRWIGIHVPAWALAMTAIFLGASVPSEGWPAWAIALAGAAGAALGGTLLGAVTAPLVVQLEPLDGAHHLSLAGKICAVSGRS